MAGRLQLALVTLALCCAAAVGGVVFARSQAAPSAPASGGFVGSLRPPGVPPFDFALRDEQGERVRLSDSRGRVTVVTFAYSTCEETCPLQVQSIRGALDVLGTDDVSVLAVSVDPGTDTASRARRFLSRERMTGRMRFLLGTRAELEPVWRHYGIQPQGEGFERSAYVLLVDASGRQRVGHPIGRLTAEGLAHDLRILQG